MLTEYEAVASVTTYPEKSVGLQFRSVQQRLRRGYWTEGLVKLLSLLFGPGIQIEKNWGRLMSRMPLFQQKWAERKLSLKNWDVVLNTYIAPDIYFPLTAVLCLKPNMMKLERLFFYLLWKWSVPMSRWPICFQYPLNGSLGMPWLMMLCRALRLRYWQRFVNAGEQVRSLQNAPSRNSSYWPNCYHGAN